VRLTFVRLLVDECAACCRFCGDVMQFPVTYGAPDRDLINLNDQIPISE